MTSAKSTSERRFFLWMAIVIFATNFLGFGSQVATGRTWFADFPWQVHVHAVIFSTWITLFVVQSWLIAGQRNVHLHRRLGWLATALAALMVPLGIAVTFLAVARGSVRGLLPPGLFLALDVFHIVGFGALTYAAIRMRNRSDWHKRLILCGSILLTAPALTRLFGFLPLGNAMPLAVILTLLILVGSGILFDKLHWRHIHPAYWWGLASLALVEILIVPVGTSSPVVAYATKLEGSAGARR